MSCTTVDVKAYFLGELAASEKSSLEGHLHGCQSCREELERLNLTRAALLSLVIASAQAQQAQMSFFVTSVGPGRQVVAESGQRGPGLVQPRRCRRSLGRARDHFLRLVWWHADKR